MKHFLLLSTLLLASNLGFATSPQDLEISRLEIKEVKLDAETRDSAKLKIHPGFGEILTISQDIVALGEQVYTLIARGKPSVMSEFAAINVLPRDPGTNTPIDAFDLEGVLEPVMKKFKVDMKNKKGKVVMTFNFVVVFEPGGSYNGKGSYILNAMVIPTASVTYGKDFGVKMKLQGIANRGTKANPIAAATLTLTYTLGSLINAIEDVTLVHINGLGKISVQ